MVRPRGKKQEATADTEERLPWKDGMDVNAIVSYNVKAVRERRGMTQEDVAAGLARLTGHRLPQASISAMERGFDGDRRRRFDAHELYLLSVVFGVPIAYFFIPPPTTGAQVLADAQRPVSELYAWLLGKEWQLPLMDERLADINITNPETVDEVLAALFGAEGAANNWHDHFRTWRKKRLAELAKTYGDRLDDVAEFLAEFALQVRQLGPKDYLLSHGPPGRRGRLDPTSTRRTDHARLGGEEGRPLVRQDRARPRSGDRAAPPEVALGLPDEAGGRAGSGRPAVEVRSGRVRRAVAPDPRRVPHRVARGDRADGAPSTFDSYSRNVRNHVIAHIGSVRLTKVDAGVLNGLYAKLLALGTAQVLAEGAGLLADVVERALELRGEGVQPGADRHPAAR